MPTVFQSALSPLCPQTVVWEAKASRDAYGKPSYAAPVSYAPPTGGRRDFGVIRKAAGGNAVDFINGSIIWILAAVPVGLEDRVYISGDAEPYPPVLFVERKPDETGVEVYTKVTLGSALGQPGGLAK